MSSRGSLSRSAVLCLTAAAAVSVLGCGEPSSPNPPPLPAPTNLTVQQLPSGDIEVTWQDNSDDEQAFELGSSRPPDRAARSRCWLRWAPASRLTRTAK